MDFDFPHLAKIAQKSPFLGQKTAYFSYGTECTNRKGVSIVFFDRSHNYQKQDIASFCANFDFFIFFESNFLKIVSFVSDPD